MQPQVDIRSPVVGANATASWWRAFRISGIVGASAPATVAETSRREGKGQDHGLQRQSAVSAWIAQYDAGAAGNADWRVTTIREQVRKREGVPRNGQAAHAMRYVRRESR